MAHDVFISYSSRDKAIADAICNSLENRKIRCWIAPRDVLPGIPYPKAIIDAINSCKVLVLVYSASALESKDIESEVGRAYKKGIPILPFKIEDVPLNDIMDYYIGNVHWLDAMTPPLEKHLQQLVDKIQVHISDPNTIHEKITSEKIEPSVSALQNNVERTQHFVKYLKKTALISIFFGIVITVKSLVFGFWLYDKVVNHIQTGDFLWDMLVEAAIIVIAGITIIIVSDRVLKKLIDAVVIAFFSGLIMGLTIAVMNLIFFLATNSWDKPLNIVVNAGGIITIIASEFGPQFEFEGVLFSGLMIILFSTIALGIFGVIYWGYRWFLKAFSSLEKGQTRGE
ncbi:hypothetical protein MCP_1875 [Methanocella paludicola SANAE]|uniref:TIR domain-containing protein n=1 Tax=Methanocella paludicola (strain DSM 17711 / JCM 13418 / NBRC 101707 / SANAE) TaxID=304371 RepID=D1YZS5_METPS|nr:toll/interleukin-1 receptor domain-containing protein [Methanocella paludicola]BAI61947.1 hypothetical protein MCP_1875 [Methanocella paludicola SANAE]